ncbi:inverse autotransporter beta domain-containing protein, partial [Xenorhabdus santafensis]|uniref:inverse autotransporter beta domain-containing protein n=1 Tax=Xenorhabdus santafensis TaxID=2582833 RepID=UPI0029E805A5
MSSSPAELAEQAKTYALNKINNTVTSEAQKWLSQFGTARINFGLDKQWTLKNSTFNFLWPIYDNKADWLIFSQLSYRNRDNRDTANLGIGGRYFYQNWMYGLNTFYDHDLTGKNQRLGFGGEIWSDYIKFSANTYWRLSDWKNSRDFGDSQERPANGYDIKGEFFLPAYPNLGAKLSYEQYFGNDVTLFQNIKQKDPNAAKFGLTYTPVPLLTVGVDYKQGKGGHTETQFMANINYKLGVPFSVQLSPKNVDAMRTLAGSRYDLVDRNNSIVLEHQKKNIIRITPPENIVGYSQESRVVTAKLTANTPVKRIRWLTSQAFKEHGGKLFPEIGEVVNITLPNYVSGINQNNNYPVYVSAELLDDEALSPVTMQVTVRPFMLKKNEKPNFTPAGPLFATGKKEDGYTFNPVITFDSVNGTPIKNTTIKQVQWVTEPKVGEASGLKFEGLDGSETAELNGDGHFRNTPVLTSTKPHKEVKVYLQLDGQPPQLVGVVSFEEEPASYKVGTVDVLPKEPVIADGKQSYTYTATILDSHNKPARNQRIAQVNWSINKYVAGLTLIAENENNGVFTTDPEGKLKATLTSKFEIKDVLVSLSIDNQQPVSAQQAVAFTPDTA